MMLGRGSLDVSEFEKKPAIKSDTYAQHVVNLRLPSHPNYQSAKKVGKEFCNNCIFFPKNSMNEIFQSECAEIHGK